MIFENFESILNMKESALSCKDVLVSVFENNETETKYFTKNLHSPLNETKKTKYTLFPALRCTRLF